LAEASRRTLQTLAAAVLNFPFGVFVYFYLSVSAFRALINVAEVGLFKSTMFIVLLMFIVLIFGLTF